MVPLEHGGGRAMGGRGYVLNFALKVERKATNNDRERKSTNHGRAVSNPGSVPACQNLGEVFRFSTSLPGGDGVFNRNT